MNNSQFIQKYGKYEFRFLKDIISSILFNYKYKRIIGGFKLHNNKNYAHIYYKKETIILEYATIWSLTEKEFINLCKNKYNKQQERKITE